jgi:TRAP-type mannitol/chloroaromatic compound transport system substrate-binding protein
VPRFVERVRTMSDGAIEITPFPPGALIPTFELLDAVGNGVVDIGYSAMVYWRGRFPFMEWAWGVPFAFSELDHYDYLFHEAGLFEVVEEALATAGVQFLGPIYSDEWGSIMSRVPIKSTADLQGLKIRSAGLGSALWESYGASPTIMPGEEIYTALSTGVVDAVNWGSPDGMVAGRFQEVAKYYIGPSLIKYDMEDMFMNKATHDSMPESLQAIMKAAVRQYAIERAATSTFNSALAFGIMADAGVEVSLFPDDEIADMRARVAEMFAAAPKPTEYEERAYEIIKSTSDTLAQRIF